ncbi:Nucleoside-diphosphate-sugar epimerase [Anaerovirgula multivorans]|uniref:Nucleoside-diphosphate-sugar epimerase n=1 Tax=Anaerovirgula multivorans TaxID=312168 RepID=A0A239EFU3_9FIRM|nr:NAD(P)-dependent oxidoreductase [Anaerovirgula multivorans]SNS43419.1 Nucleoside-diphosphate-sugar epimerase [Anaerovirgula multivorans]
MEKILITGGNGFVGSYLMRQLAPKYEVYGLSKRGGQSHNFIQCDITKKEEVINKLRNIDFDYVIHCAAIAHNDNNKFTKDDFFQVNTIGTQNLVEVFKEKENLKLFIFFSTVSVYGERDYKTDITENADKRPIISYAKSKSKAEDICLETQKIPCTILRFPVIYDKCFMKDIYKRVLTKGDGGRLMFKIGNGQQRFSFCNIENVLSAVEIVLKNYSNTRNEIYNVTDENSYTINNVISIFRELNSTKKIIIWVPKILVKALFNISSVVLREKKQQLKTFYWKLAENNIYSTKKIKRLGYMPSKDLYSILDKI